MSRFINPVPQFWLNDGSIASSGKMVFFENGDYSTKKDTYSQSDNTVPNTNPVTLDGSGRMPACFGDGLYSVKFYAYDNAAVDKLGTLQWTRDDVSLSELTGQFTTYNPLDTYLIGDIVRASDGEYYRSLVGANIGNDPVSSPVQWEQIVFITLYNANRTYQINDTVISAGLLYRANTANLIGIIPPATEWDNLTFNNTITGNLTVSGTVTAASYAGGDLSKTTDSGITLPKYKTGATARGSTTTLAADPDLTSTTLAATYYSFKAIIHWNGNGSATNGIKIRVGSSSANITQIYIANTNTTSSNLAPTSNESGGIPNGFVKLPNTAGANEVLIIEGFAQTILAGTLYVEWSQAASEATTTRVLAGSHLLITKL